MYIATLPTTEKWFTLLFQCLSTNYLQWICFGSKNQTETNKSELCVCLYHKTACLECQPCSQHLERHRWNWHASIAFHQALTCLYNLSPICLTFIPKQQLETYTWSLSFLFKDKKAGSPEEVDIANYPASNVVFNYFVKSQHSHKHTQLNIQTASCFYAVGLTSHCACHCTV